MTFMTPAEKETSRRVCEALGAAVCALVTWGKAVADITAKTQQVLFIDWLTMATLTGLIVGLGYGAAFCFLDAWWSKVYANYRVELRPNWAIIPFLGAWLAFSIISLCFNVLETNGRWFFVTLAVAVAWGLVTWGIMFFFWLIGVAIRTVRTWMASYSNS